MTEVYQGVMELNVQKYLRSGKSLEDLSKEFYIKANRSTHLPSLVLLKYDQLNSPSAHPIVVECRGIILDEANDWRVVCYSFNRFFNLGEGHAAKLDWPNTKILAKLDGCFRYDTGIDLWEGGSEDIGRIVRHSLRPVLKGVDKNGNIVPAYITNTFNNGRKSNWIRLTFDQNINTGGSGSRGNSLLTTTNHHLFVNGDYKAAGEVRIGDELLTYQFSPDDLAIKYIEASLLGDGYVSPLGCYMESHINSKKEFNDLVTLYLGDSLRVQEPRISGYGSEMIRSITYAYPILKKLRDKWYSTGAKSIPQNLDFVDDFAVAKWYMDDGNRAHSEVQEDRAILSSNAFSKEDCIRLANKLIDLYGVKCTVCDNKGWIIRINAGRKQEINVFWEAIAPYIPEDMQYKLPQPYRGKFMPPQKTSVIKRKVALKVVAIESVPVTKVNFPSGSVGFDIETTTNNYFANGVLVHNSLAQFYYYRGNWNWATSGNPDAAGEVGYDNGITFHKLMSTTMFDKRYLYPSMTDTNKSFAFELTSPYNKIIVSHSEPDLTLLAVRNLDTLEEEDPEKYAEKYGWKLVEENQMVAKHPNQVEWATSLMDGSKQEGYVCVDKNFNRIKVKSPQYVLLHRFKSSFSKRNLFEIALIREDSEVASYFPEYIEEFNKYESDITNLINNAEELWQKYKDIGVQKEFAQAALAHSCSSVLFAKRKNPDMPISRLVRDCKAENVWKMIYGDGW